MSRDNKSLGRFDLSDIPSAPRGVPQIEVTFDIDANGILHVSAKDKATGKQQSIRITASSGLSEDEIKRMVRDAELHAEEDKRMHDLVTARNHADSLIHSTQKTLQEVGEKVSADDRGKIDAAISDLKAVLDSDDHAEIERKTQRLTELTGKMAEQLYAAEQGGAAASASGTEQQSSAGGGSNKPHDDAVDAEFEEVNDTRK